MTKHPWLLFVSFLNAFVLRVRHSIVALLCASLLLFSTGCWFSASDLRWSQPSTPIIQICDKPLDVPDDVNLWGYDFVTKRLVTGEHPADLRLFDNADAFFEYNPDAPASSALEMPSEYGLTCAKRAASFVDASVHSFPPSSDLFRSQKPCPAQVADTVNRAASHFFADTTGAKKPCETPKARPVRVHVCARPPSVGNNVDEWGILDVKGIRLTRSEEDFQAEVAKATIIFVFDENAIPESVYWFVQDPKKLACPNKPAPKPYDQVIGSGMLEVINAATSMGAALNPATPKKGDGKTTETSSADGKGPPLNFLELLARNLQYAAALAAADTSGDPKDPNGKRFGMLGGKNVDGPDLLILQAAAGTFAIIGIPFKSGKTFIERIITARTEKKVAVILDPAVLSKEIAQELAKNPTADQLEKALKGEIVESYGMAMAMSLQEAQVIMPYSRAEIFTKGWAAKFQAHHILEVNKFETLWTREMADNGPAIVLTKAQHDYITGELAKAQKEMMAAVMKRGDKIPTKADVWAMYQKVYKDQPNWLKAIEHYFQ